MTINYTPIFQTNAFSFSCDDNLTDRILDLVKKESYFKIDSNNISHNDYFFDRELFDWFDDCLYKVKKELGFPNHLTLPITTCWTTKTTKLMAHHQHHHPNSFISAIFYLTSHDSGPTIFYQDNYWVSQINKQFKIDKNNFKQNSSTGKLYPKKSTLILFPSNIRHSVGALTKNEERYTISFNTYINGVLSDSTEKTKLEIKAASVRDYHNPSV